MSALTTAAAQLPPPPEPPEVEGTPAKPKRPTTRAARAAAAAARKDKPKADSKPRGGAGKPKTDIRGSVDGLHQLAGMAVLPMVGMPVTGQALAACGPDAGAAWAEAAQRYPWIEKAFGTGQDGLVLFKLLMIYAPLISVAMAEKSGQLGAPTGAADPLAGLAAMMGAATAPDAPGVPAGQNANGRP